MKPSKWPLIIYLSTGAYLEIIEKGWSVRRKKLKADLTQNKIFDFSMMKQLANVFHDEIKFFWDFIFDIKAAPPSPVITIQQKIPRDIFTNV